MSAQPQIIEMSSDVDEIVGVLEERDAAAIEPTPKGRLPQLNLPLSLIVIAGIAVLFAGAGFLLGSNVTGASKDAKQSAHAENADTPTESVEATYQTDSPVELEQTINQGDAQAMEDETYGDVDQATQDDPAAPRNYGDISYTDNGAVYHTAPMSVPVTLDGKQKELTLSLGILVEDRSTAELLKDQGLTVNLLTIEAAQSVDFGPFLNWEIPGLITKDLRSRLEAEYPEANIRAIMIRDFEL